MPSRFLPGSESSKSRIGNWQSEILTTSKLRPPVAVRFPKLNRLYRPRAGVELLACRPRARARGYLNVAPPALVEGGLNQVEGISETVPNCPGG